MMKGEGNSMWYYTESRSGACEENPTTTVLCYFCASLVLTGLYMRCELGSSPRFARIRLHDRNWPDLWSDELDRGADNFGATITTISGHCQRPTESMWHTGLAMGYRSLDFGLMQDLFSLLRSVFLKFNISGTAGNLTSSPLPGPDQRLSRTTFRFSARPRGSDVTIAWVLRGVNRHGKKSCSEK